MTDTIEDTTLQLVLEESVFKLLNPEMGARIKALMVKEGLTIQQVLKFALEDYYLAWYVLPETTLPCVVTADGQEAPVVRGRNWYKKGTTVSEVKGPARA